ncbi:hypothetical protein GCM10027614_82390 [Micromonospora vulcania]
MVEDIGPPSALFVGADLPCRQRVTSHEAIMQMRPMKGNTRPMLRPQQPSSPRRCGGLGLADMTVFRIGEAADLVGVSVDTMRRWVDAGRVAAVRDEHGHRVIRGIDLATFVQTQAAEPEDRADESSARNRLRGSSPRWSRTP